MKKYLPSWLQHKSNYSQLLVWLFLISLAYLLYSNLGRDALFDWDEGIYAELGRTLVTGRNLLVSFWNGSPWLEKPPGIAWATAFGIALVGPSALGARLLMPLFAIYTLYIVYRIGTHFGSSKHGLIAAGVLAGFNLFLGRTRAVNTDMPLLASIVTTILFLLENRPAWWVALALAGGVWFKGIAGFLSVIIAFPLFFSKNKKFLINLFVVSLLLILPWHLYAYLKYGSEFLTPYLFEQVVRRATAQLEFHFETRWYYFNYLYENLGLGVLLVAGVGASISVFTRKNLYLLSWVIIPLALFTLAKTRLFWYILPIYPAFALLIAQAIGHWQKDVKSKGVVAILTLGICLQSLILTSRSVELGKTSAPLPDRIQVAQALGKTKLHELAVLVPPSERLSEALLPAVARLTSSFRYGGMPSVVYYFAGPVKFFYDVDKFKTYWQESATATAMIAADDLDFVPGSYSVVVTTSTYLGIQKGVYALR